jgi:type II secretory pathway pseudopilin PulG
MMELMVVIAILGVLGAISSLWMMDTFHSARDTAALSDAKNLITIINNNFLDNESIRYDSLSADGSQIGVMEEDGTTPRVSVYGLSPGVEIKFITTPNISSKNPDVQGFFDAWLYHPMGTPDPLDLSLSGVGRKVIQCAIDEASGVQEYIIY